MHTKLKVSDLSNEYVLFTDTLTNYTRYEAQQLVIDKSLFEELTTYKLTWALKHETRIIGETEFRQLIKPSH